MLYERWRDIAREHADEIALCDLAQGKQWTFRQLAADAEPEPSGPGLSCPQGAGAEFVFAVVRAWGAGTVVCPLEPGQAAPQVRRLPPGIVHLKTTSASTGKPRLVAFTARQLMADPEHIVRTMGLKPEWPNLAAISLAHSYGFSSLVLPLLLHGIPLYLLGTVLPEAVRNALTSLPAITLPAVPALWRAWLTAGVLSPQIRLAISAGAPLSLALEQEVLGQTGIKIHNFYGSTECGGIAYDGSATPRTHEGCVGAALHDVRLTIGADGCLEVRSAAVGQTYWPEPAPQLGQGLYRTTDLAEIRQELIFLHGRAGDQINVAGRKLSPEVIEETLRLHPVVKECVVFGVPSRESDRAETIVACLWPTAPVTIDALRQFLLERLPGWQVPRDWWFVEELQANARGKISRAEYREKYLAGPRSLSQS